MKLSAFIINTLVTIVLPLQNLAVADTPAKVMVLDFQLNDLTDIPNAHLELERIKLLSSTYKHNLNKLGVNIVPVADKLKIDMDTMSPTYLFDHIEYLADIAAENGADYALVGVAFKPTYLFVYP